MSQKANYFKLGLFVIGALVAGVVVVLVIGSGRWFERKITIETYFNESVQGLDLGSKIKFKGVVIGDVTKISFTYGQYQQGQPMLRPDSRGRGRDALRRLAHGRPPGARKEGSARTASANRRPRAE